MNNHAASTGAFVPAHIASNITETASRIELNVGPEPRWSDVRLPVPIRTSRGGTEHRTAVFRGALLADHLSRERYTRTRLYLEPSFTVLILHTERFVAPGRLVHAVQSFNIGVINAIYAGVDALPVELRDALRADGACTAADRHLSAIRGPLQPLSNPEYTVEQFVRRGAATVQNTPYNEEESLTYFRDSGLEVSLNSENVAAEESDGEEESDDDSEEEDALETVTVNAREITMRDISASMIQASTAYMAVSVPTSVGARDATLTYRQVRANGDPRARLLRLLETREVLQSAGQSREIVGLSGGRYTTIAQLLDFYPSDPRVACEIQVDTSSTRTMLHMAGHVAEVTHAGIRNRLSTAIVDRMAKLWLIVNGERLAALTLDSFTPTMTASGRIEELLNYLRGFASFRIVGSTPQFARISDRYTVMAQSDIDALPFATPRSEMFRPLDIRNVTQPSFPEPALAAAAVRPARRQITPVEF